MSIKIENLTKVFENGNKALDDVSINFQKNKITGLIGFNGSGKTTTFNILSRFIDKYSGNISIGNKPIDLSIRKKMVFLAAGAEPKNQMKAIKHLLQIAFIYGVETKQATNKIEQLAKKLEFTSFLNKPIRSLSKGNQQKIKIIASLLNPEVEIMFLDEPFDGLDPIMVKKASKLFLDLKNVTIILTSHRMEVVNGMCEEFFVLKEGKLIDSRRTNDTSIVLEVNKEVPIDNISKLKYVLNVKTKNDKHLIVINDIKHFVDLNKLLLKSEKFSYCSIKDKNVADSVFEGYGV